MIRLFLPAVLLLSSLAALAEDPPLQGIKACNKAIDLIDQDKPAEALAVLEAAKGTMKPDDEWVWWGNKGHAHWDLRQDTKALEAFAKAVELKKDCWFRVHYANLLHEFGRWEEALALLDGPIDPDYADRAKRLRAVIEGPYRKRWPHAWKKLEYTGKLGHYQVISDVGVTAAGMDKIEAEAAKINPADGVQKFKLEQLCKPSADLVNVYNMLELTRKEYMKLSGMTEAQWPKGKVCRVFFLGNQQEFLDFAKAAGDDDTHESTLGFFDPNFKYIQLYNREGGGWVCGIGTETLDTFWHEGWHQFFDVLTTQRPDWINEGLAEFVGKGDVSEDGSRLTLGTLVKSRGDFVTRYERIKEVVTALRHVPFRDFFRCDGDKWEAGDVLAHYAQAWAVVYYALRGDNEAFRKDFRKLFAEIVKGTAWADAVKAVFPDGKLDEYEKKWISYIERLE
ncbi:MAG: DUF1570 domain-containing protein [Planctomycetes bacterium]|nr:DUF1570 domain-containing protein [Planctomycetota bacterium]